MAEETSNEYILGGSSSELDRIHGIHESTVDYMGTLLLPPIDFSSLSLRVLDSGTAGGRWLQDLRQEKGAGHEYVGTDITASFFPEPTNSEDDKGITYQLQDVTHPWPQDWLGTFDLVHQRFVLGGVRKPLLKDTVMNLISLTKPGGWIELMESDVSEAVINDDTNGAAPIWKLLRSLYVGMGVEPEPERYLRGWFEEAGLVNIQEERVVVPVGTKRADVEMGKRSAHTMAVTAQHLVMGAKQMGITVFSPEELDALPAKVQSALSKEGGSYSVYAIYAQKP